MNQANTLSNRTPSPTLTRRRFIASGGAITVGFSMAATLPGLAQAAPAVNGQLAADAWLRIAGAATFGDASGAVVTVYAGKVELGTGIQTALTQMVAEELFVTMAQVRYVQGDTEQTPGSQGFTAGSKSVQNDGPPMRRAAAAAMQQLLALAAVQFGVPVANLRAFEGRIGVGANLQKAKSYAKVVGSQTLAVTSTASTPTKSPADYTLVGTSVQRMDLPGKLTGRHEYVGDVKLPGMLHARVIRPSGRNAKLVSASAAAAAGVPGFVRLVVQGNFVAVVATDENAAVAAVAALAPPPPATPSVVWAAGTPLISQASLPTALKDPANIYTSGNEIDLGNVDTALATAGATLSATYFTPFQMHGGFAASCAVADVRGNQATVWACTQGPYPLRAALAPLLGLPVASVRVVYREGSGCYGHNGADDVAAEAALISKAVGQPVRLQWTRAEEHQWEPLGAAMLHEMKGGVTGASVVAWQHSIYSPTHGSRPNSGNSAGNLLPAQQASGVPPADAPALNTNSATRNGPVTYDRFANNRLVRNFVKSFNLVPGTRTPATPLTWVLPRTTALRSLGGLSNTFANESFMDELARQANADPVVFRKTHLTDPRALDVLDAVALRAGWGTPLPAQPAGFKTGRGVGYLRYETVEAYVAVVAEVVVEVATGVVRVTRVVVAHDCGQIINPDGLRNQIEGNVIQGISRTLKEQVDYGGFFAGAPGDRIQNNAWVDYAPYFQVGYRVIQFDEIPVIETVLIDRPYEVSWGAGEPVIGALPGAIGNAICQATGARVRSLPMRPATVLAALAVAPSGRTRGAAAPRAGQPATQR